MLAATWGEHHRKPGRLPVDARAGRRQHGERRRPCVPRPLAADRHHRCLFAPDHEIGLRQRINQLACTSRSSSGAPRSTPRRCASRCAAPCAPRPARRRGRCISSCRRARRRARPASTWPSRRWCQPVVPGPTAPTSAGARMLETRAAADHPRGPRRILEQCRGRARRAGGGARRARAHHVEMQGRDPGRPPAARRLHHRRR